MRPTTKLQNGYEFIDGVAMHAEMGERFQVPHPVIARNAGQGHLVEVRIDSSRFSVHADAPDQCQCEHCNEKTSKPVLCHQEPASLLSIPRQAVPSRGWGEQFWVEIAERQGSEIWGRVDNTLYESRLHGLQQDDMISFCEEHILSVHGSQLAEIALQLDEQETLEFVDWLRERGMI